MAFHIVSLLYLWFNHCQRLFQIIFQKSFPHLIAKDVEESELERAILFVALDMPDAGILLAHEFPCTKCALKSLGSMYLTQIHV